VSSVEDIDATIKTLFQEAQVTRLGHARFSSRTRSSFVRVMESVARGST